MPTFLTDEEFTSLASTGDVAAVADKADSFIQTLRINMETVKAEANADAITAEQTCSILEERFLSLSSEFSALESRNSQLESELQQHASELALARSEKHQIHIKLIEKDGDFEQLKAELLELQKSNRQLVEIVGVKDIEISEKNSTIRSYLDKVSGSADRAAQREAKLNELQAELMRCKANCDKLSQEKELIEKHNAWLSDELNTKVDSLLEHRRRSGEIEVDLSAKLADMEKQYNESSSSLNRHKERVKELESKLDSLHQELCSVRDDASAAEKRYSAEISTVSKLVDLYKESSEEWSKKAGDLEGVIKALETHLSQVESDYNARLQQESDDRKKAEKESTELREKLAKCEAELESNRRASEMDILPLSGFTTKALAITSGSNDDFRDDSSTVPHVSAGVSGTALAASLLRDGWSLAKMYGKYQEAADAWRHEQMGRKKTEVILERVLLEIEEKASVILDERAEHERMINAYTSMEQKVQQLLSEKANLEKVIRELKAEMKRCERETNNARMESLDLQKQVTILLKECHDLQLRCGSVNTLDDFDDALTVVDDETNAQKVLSKHLLSIKDIKGLVEQNAKLRCLARSLSDELEKGELQLKTQFEEELLKHKEEAASRVAAVLERSEEQGRMIESLHSSVSMYRRLYEEEHRLRSSQPQTYVAPSADGRKDFLLLLEGSQEATKRVQEQASERVRSLEDELAKLKAEILSLRSERDKLSIESNRAQDKLQTFMKEFDLQREELNGVLARNIEFTKVIVDYQKMLRDGSDSVHAAEEHTRKLNAELSLMRREKELLKNSERRALDEVQELSQRVYRLQATLDTIQGAQQDREEAKAAERTKQEEYIKQIEREWSEAKRELEGERNNVRSLSLEHERKMKDAQRENEDMGKELAAAQRALAAAETKIAVAEARYSDLERNLTSADDKTGGRDSAPKPPSSGGEATGDLRMAKQEIERLKAESLAIKDHMLQYKSIAEVNEAALKQMEAAHESFKNEAEQLKKSMEADIQSLMDRVQELESESIQKSKEAASIATQKDEELASALSEIVSLKEENSNKVSQIMAVEVQVGLLKEDLMEAQQHALAAQTNYERRVILQSETIQELTKTSKVLTSVQEELCVLRRTVDGYKSENAELKAKWGSEKSELEKLKCDAQKKYDELNEQNKILHSQLEALHIKLEEKDHTSTGVASASGSDGTQGESGLHGVVSYLRRSREIADTEISLLKQEKLRLQSQLERALKVAEAAEASRSAERADSRNFLFTEDEFKALKLQVSEMSLLRESNMQLREENRRNFEECQRLREVAQVAKTEAEKLQSTLKERESEHEGLVKEIEWQKREKELLDRRISDMLEASKDVDFEEYNRLKNEVEQLRANIREKEAAIKESEKLVSQKQDLLGKLEQNLASIRSERDNLIPQVEGLRLDLEKQRKLVITCKRLTREKEALVKEKEASVKEKVALVKEKESLLKVRESLEKEKDSLLKENEVLSREKEELAREKQAVLKQLEDLRQEKKTAADTPVDLAMREKEKEKDARMQILESTLGRLREENKKEKESRRTIEKIIQVKARKVDLERKKFEGEHENYKDAVRKFSEELEKLKHSKDSLPEGTAVVQLLSTSNLDDLASAYVLAVENFEREAHLILNDVGNQGSASSSAMDATPVAAATAQVPPAEVSTTMLPGSAPISQPGKALEEREKKIYLPKSNAEARKSGRRLLRPQFQSEKQRDVEMSDADGSKNVEKPSSVQEKAKQTAVRASSEPTTRKRPVSPSPSEPQEEPFRPADSSTDLPVPSLKKCKVSDSVPEHAQAQSGALENVETTPTLEELLDAVTDVPQVLSEEISDFQGLGTEAGVTKQPIDEAVVDVQKDNVVDHEHAGKATDPELLLDEASDLQAEQDVQPIIDAGDREEGEMFPESSDIDVGDDTAIGKIQDASDYQLEHSTMPSPARINEETVAAIGADANETNSPEVPTSNEQMEEGELAEAVAEDSDKSNRDDDQTAGDTDSTSEVVSGATEGNMSAVECIAPKEDSSDITTGQDAGHSSLGKSKIVNLNEIAKKKRAERLGQEQSPATSISPVPERRRGRGGPMTRNRGGRLRRGGHRQSPSNQG